MSHFAQLVAPVFPQSELQRYSSIKDFCEGVSRGDVPLVNDSNVFVKLTDSFLKVRAQYRNELYRRFSYADPKIVEWQYVNFFSAYLILSEAMNRKLYSETFIEFCLTPGKFIADEKSAVEWASVVQGKISLRYPSGSLKLPQNTRDSIRAYTRSRIWFFMATNSKDPKELINKIKSRPDFVSACYFSARLYNPVNVIINYRMEEIRDPKSIFSMYRCPIDNSSAMCETMIRFMDIHNVRPLNIVRMQNGGQDVVSFRLTLSTPEDIPQLKRTFGSRLCECPIVKVWFGDRGAEFLNLLAECSKCVPLSIVPSPDKSLIVTFFDDYMLNEFKMKYKQKYEHLNEPKGKVNVAYSSSVEPHKFFSQAPTGASAPKNPSRTLDVTYGNFCATTNYSTPQIPYQAYSQQATGGILPQRNLSPPTNTVTLSGYSQQPYGGAHQFYPSPPPTVSYRQPQYASNGYTHQRQQSPPPSGSYQQSPYQTGYSQQYQQQPPPSQQGYQQPPPPSQQGYQQPPSQQGYSRPPPPQGSLQMQSQVYNRQY